MLAHSESFDEWRDHYLSTPVPVDVVANDRCRDCLGACYDTHTPSNGGLTTGALGSLNFSDVTAGSVDIQRTRTTIRMSDPDLIKVGLLLRGRVLLVQHDREAMLTPGDLVLYESSHPYLLRFESHFTWFYLTLPRNRLRLSSKPEPMAAVRIRGDDGLGALVSPMLVGLRQSLSEVSCSATPMFEDAVCDLIAATLSGHSAQSITTPGEAILTSAKSFIDTHLADPGLDTSMIAAAHHISARYLQKLFKAGDLTVAGWIRRRRLEHCRRDLQDRGLAHQSIGAICARYGLIDSAHFSRLFKEAYGVSPRAFRDQSRSCLPG